MLPAWVGIYGIIMFLAHTIAWQAAAYGSANATFTPELLEVVLDAHGEQKGRKQAWADAASNAFAYRK